MTALILCSTGWKMYGSTCGTSKALVGRQSSINPAFVESDQRQFAIKRAKQSALMPGVKMIHDGLGVR